MPMLFYIAFPVLVVAASAVVTYAISISRERLWLRAKKTEDIYFKADELGFELDGFFKHRYDLAKLTTTKRDGREIRALNRQLVELNVLVGLYFPALAESHAVVTAAAASAFNWLSIAETSPEADIEHALHSLDYAVAELKVAIAKFKTKVLTVGSIDRVGRFYDNVLNHRRHVEADRILAHSA